MNMKKYLPSQGEVIFGVVWSVCISIVVASHSIPSMISSIGISLGTYLMAGVAVKVIIKSIKDKYENSKTY